MTPIRVRGKRTGTKQEKWHDGKQRKPARYGSVTASDRSSSGYSTSSLAKATAWRRRKRLDPNLSRLEQLPTEMLQSIFEYSANVDMALVSPCLASQLDSKVLQAHLTSSILHEVLGHQRLTASLAKILRALRLMNSKFFTWTFFQNWLHSEFDRLKLREEWQAAVGYDADSPDASQRRDEWTWYRLNPSPELPPPSKLLNRPFTDDKVRFLNFLIGFFRGDPQQLGPVYSEMVQDGLQQVVEDGMSDALNAFFCLGARVDTELLRQAVIDDGCVKDVVRRLITRTTHLTSEPVAVDFLDPALWAWADKARLRGNEKGPWLLTQLQSAARDAGQGSGDIEAK